MSQLYYNKEKKISKKEEIMQLIILEIDIESNI